MTEVETRSRKTAKHTASATGRFLQLLRHPIDDVRGDFLNLVDGDLELVLAAVPRVHQIDLIFAAGLRLGQIRVEAAVHVHFGALAGRQHAQQGAHVGGGHRQEQVGTVDFLTRDAVCEVVTRNLITIATFA